MSYVSIDIETTGLDPDTCQVLEVGAVFEDWKSPISQLPEFRQILKYTELRGNPFALALNANLLKLIANPQPEHCQPQELGQRLANWVRACGLDPMDLPAAGKNFASFDRQFLERLPDFTQYVKFRHRTLDPAMLFWRPYEDERLPGSKTCYERAGLGGKVMHTAVDDARAVAQLMRVGLRHLTYTTKSENGNAEGNH
jgi:DNA polymerase III alpha subunit (gram-positive type)